MLVNEFLFKKWEKLDFAFIDSSPVLFSNKPKCKEFVISVLPDTRSITGPWALLLCTLCMVDLLAEKVESNVGI